MKYQNLCCRKETCFLCQEEISKIRYCQYCSYIMCINCYQTYINYNYTQCPQCRNELTENVNSIINIQLDYLRVLPLQSNYLNHQHWSLCRSLITGIGTLLLLLSCCYWIGFLITKQHQLLFIVNIFLGFLFLLLVMLILVTIYSICCV